MVDSLFAVLPHLKASKVLVIGDLMLDKYTFGKVGRISPEAPVSIFKVEEETSRLGGTGNVILNLLSLGAEVRAMGRVGNDDAGEEILSELIQKKIGIENIFIQEGYPTPVKNRVLADNQQVIRIDAEAVISLSKQIERLVIERVEDLLKGIEIIAISDYGKGMLSDKVLKMILQLAREKGIFIIVDPKGADFRKYKGANMIKPNLSEAYAAANLSRKAPLSKVAKTILATAECDMLMVTRSEEGISLFYRDGSQLDFPVTSKEVRDVTGAGDTVLAALCVALASKLDIARAIELANIAAGMSIERAGCVQIDLQQIAERLLELNIENKIFNEAHFFALQKALTNKKTLLFGIKSRDALSTQTYRHIRALSLEYPQHKLIIYFCDESPNTDFIDLISSLSEVDFILLRSDQFHRFLQEIGAEKTYLSLDEHLTELQSPLDLIKELALL
jgi:D-beta-D-heptose 7-phosphate kinase / D-beta-D-heptose 1-phosphate adenosyltransferase